MHKSNIVQARKRHSKVNCVDYGYTLQRAPLFTSQVLHMGETIFEFSNI